MVTEKQYSRFDLKQCFLHGPIFYFLGAYYEKGQNLGFRQMRINYGISGFRCIA